MCEMEENDSQKICCWHLLVESPVTAIQLSQWRIKAFLPLQIHFSLQVYIPWNFYFTIFYTAKTTNMQHTNILIFSQSLPNFSMSFALTKPTLPGVQSKPKALIVIVYCAKCQNDKLLDPYVVREGSKKPSYWNFLLGEGGRGGRGIPPKWKVSANRVLKPSQQSM